MTAYIMVQVEVEDAGQYERYRKMVQPTLDVYGGRFLVRGGNAKTLEGSWRPARLVVIEFDSAAQAEAWWSSGEYAPARSLRQSCAHTEMILVEGV